MRRGAARGMRTSLVTSLVTSRWAAPWTDPLAYDVRRPAAPGTASSRLRAKVRRGGLGRSMVNARDTESASADSSSQPANSIRRPAREAAAVIVQAQPVAAGWGTGNNAGGIPCPGASRPQNGALAMPLSLSRSIASPGETASLSWTRVQPGQGRLDSDGCFRAMILSNRELTIVIGLVSHHAAPATGRGSFT
jgi:hypothetical protein